MRQLSLLQSAMDSYYKLRQLFYYKVRHGLFQIATVLQSAMNLLQIATDITKCDDYYDSTPSLPQIYSPVFTNLRHVCKEQSCANPFFRPLINLKKDWIPTFQDINKCMLHLFTTLLKPFSLNCINMNTFSTSEWNYDIKEDIDKWQHIRTGVWCT